jgi:hypothetical protein
MKNLTYNNEDDCYLFNCPNCNDFVQVKRNEINCKIFRHGYFKKNYEQIPPHSSKELCDELYNKNLIFGCGKPFIMIEGANGMIEKVEKCDYI